ncbi:MAG: hypothetical protein IT429_16295 [Gemmataceae bacterium]|nr:hypothetical protein [Gemmataceae bacterium]
MLRRRLLTAGLVALALIVVSADTARAARVRYHYGAGDVCGAVVSASGPQAAYGQRVSYFGTILGPAPCPVRPTHLVTFYHPHAGRNVNVPLALPPDSTPRIEHRRNRIIFNYGSDTVETIFLEDGSVDVEYNSGFGRPLSWCYRR